MKTIVIFLCIFCCCEIAAQQVVNTHVKPNSGTWTLEWSSNDQYIAMGGDDSVLHIFNGNNLKVFRSFKMNHSIKCVRWHPKKQLLAIVLNNGVQLLNMSDLSFSAAPGVTVGGRGIDWNYNGELMALADGLGVVRIINEKGELLRSMYKKDNNSYLSVSWHPTKNILITGGDHIIGFDTSGNHLFYIKHRKENAGVLTVQWHPSGTFFTSGDYGHANEGLPTVLQFWSATGKPLQTIQVSNAEYRNIRWNRNGTLLATASDALRIHDKKGKLLYIGASPQNLWGLSWNRKGDRLVTASFETSIVLWNAEAKRIRKL